MQFLVPTLGIKMIENDFPYIPTHIGDPKPVAPPLAEMIDRWVSGTRSRRGFSVSGSLAD
jgi:hypothetical protein